MKLRTILNIYQTDLTVKRKLDFYFLRIHGGFSRSIFA